MKKEFSVGTAVAAPGQKARGVIPGLSRASGMRADIPVTVINGSEDGPVLWLDGAIHGDEPEGPLAVIEIIRSLDPGELRGALVAVPAVNVPAFEAGQRGNPLDTFTYDMNRIYPGGPEGRFTERLAWAHNLEMAAKADLEISIHSGGAHSYLAPTVFFGPNDRSFDLARAMGEGWDLLLRGGGKGSPVGVMVERGKAAITVEIGGLCATLPEEFLANGAALVKAIRNVMMHYDMIDGDPVYARRWMVGVQRAVLAGAGGLFVPEEGFVFRHPVKAGTVLARIFDLYGEVVEEIKAPCDGLPFGMRTNPPVQAGEWALFFAEIQEVVEKTREKCASCCLGPND